MINSFTVTWLKAYSEQNMTLKPGINFFIGGNNSSKTTALQALALWKQVIDHWCENRGKSSSKQNVTMTRQQLTTIPTI